MLEKRGLITQQCIPPVCWRKPDHVLAFVVPSTIKLFVLHLVRGDVLNRNNPVLSRAGSGSMCSSLQTTRYSDVTISKMQEPRCMTSGTRELFTLRVDHSVSWRTWTMWSWHLPSDGSGSLDDGDLLLFCPTNEGVAAGGGNVRRAAVRQETEA